MDIKAADKIVKHLIRNVSPHLRDDCYQAAMLGVLNAAQYYDPTKSKFETYLNSHKGYIENEILKEVGRLSLPFAIKRMMMIDLIKYKRGDLKNLGKRKEANLKNLANMRSISYVEEDNED